ncbi:hypothetical protein BDY21DRAFT_306511 [Lineolata rhizophorae]|uniref:Glycosyltransferase family 25 protein n=1 Tax=Lineolata rhizophorae TaxID=578093 RepID=A0A6A6NWE9_9PEZI|nr:hypothetical protein BDY21DRAFT_306511 [Lineolata rhizophorae]
MLVGRSRVIFASVLIFLVFIFLFVPHGLRSGALDGFGRHEAANATLGFGAVAVVSAPGSTRRTHLIQMANITELDLSIPKQREWGDDDEAAFRDGKDYKIGRGSLFAWLSHRLVLEWFLETDLETVLILEDDVDWDIRLRSLQIPRAAKAFRTLMNESREPEEQYYGDVSNWDLLYVGHCGDYFDQTKDVVGVGHIRPSRLTEGAYIKYADDTMPLRYNLHPWTASILAALDVSPEHRIIHKSVLPLCSFGYAITRATARRLLDDIAPATVQDGMFAYDLALKNGCDSKLRCYSLQPELFHHMPGDSLIKQQADDPSKIGIPPVDRTGQEQVDVRKETVNIGCGFWNKSIDFGEDMAYLELLREEVGRKGRCLKSGE